MGSTSVFGRRLAMFRRRAGLSQAELGERVALSRSYISHFEAGRKQPDIEILERLALALGITQAELLGERVPGPTPEQQAIEWVGMIARHAEGMQGLPVLFAGPATTDASPVPLVEGAGRFVRVLRGWVGTRAPEDFVVVEALGHGLRGEGILPGNFVLLDRLRQPDDCDIVLMRVGETRSLLHWCDRGRLVDADSAVYEGAYVTHWNPTPDERAALAQERV